MKPEVQDPRRRRRPRRRRPGRPRGTPRWLVSRKDLDEVAKARCLMILSVLSGEKPVSEAIEGGGISRPTYYQLETRAILAMLKALHPQRSVDPQPETKQKRIAELEERVKQLERRTRRAERLLLLTRRVMEPVPLVPGRPRKTPTSPAALDSSPTGRLPSRLLKKLQPIASVKPPAAPDSIPTPDGEIEP